MKKIAALLFTLISFNAFAATWKDPNTGITWTYTVSNGKASVGRASPYTSAITIPSTLSGYPVTSIGGGAFYGCSGLTSVTIPESVEAIGNYAFDGCRGLTSITIPSSVTSIGDNAFAGCSGLKSVTIPSSVTSIGSDAFRGCSGLTSVVIPTSVTSIGNSAFMGCSGLASAIIPEGVTSIGQEAFFGCSGLTSVTIPEGVRSIGDAAFEYCSGLTSVTIPSSVTRIGDYAFSGCSGLMSFLVNGNNHSFSSKNGLLCSKDGKNLIAGVNGNVVIPEGVTSIGDGAFCGCSGLTSVAIPSSMKSIGERAFEDCSGLTSITIPSSVLSIGGWAFYGCSGLTSVAILEGVTSIGEGAFSGCSGLTSITIPSSVESIGKSAFEWCDGLTSVTISEGVTSIGERAFAACIKLTEITIPSSVTSIGWGAFSDGTGLTSVTISEGVTSIWDQVFANCSMLTSVTIPSSVTSIGNYAFSGCSRLLSITIPKGVTSIGDGAFEGCSGLTSITIPEGVTSIGYWAFSGCRGFTSVTIPSSVTSIDNYMFEYCAGLTSVTIPLSVTSIGDGAFYNCGLTSITIPSSVESIGDYAFYNCNGLTSVTIPSSVTSIGAEAFSWCAQLSSVTILEGVTSIGDGAFSGCSGLTSITIPSSVTSIGDGAFSGCSGLTEVHINDIAAWCKISFGSADANPLYYAHRLYLGDKEVTDLTIPEDVESIGDCAFYGCSWLTSVTIPEGVTSIGYYAFSGCSGLASITIPKGVTSIGDGAFEDCSGLTSITIPEGATSIGYRAFYGCSGLTSVTIPSSVTSIGGEAFYGCSGLTSISVDSMSEYYCSIDGVLYNKDATELICCPGGTRTVTIPSSVTSIGGSAFYGCSGLTSVTIPSSVTSIGGAAFYGCYNLKLVYVNRGDTNRIKNLMRDKGVNVNNLTFIEPCLVTFNANGGNCDTAGRQIAYQNAIGELPVPTKEHYDFVGWFTKLDGGEEIVASTVISADIVCYAHWVKHIYTIAFDPNGGECDVGSVNIAYQSAIGELPSPTKYGYDFVGWFTEKDGGEEITSKTIVESDATHYAHWTKHIYTVTLDTNGGECDIGSVNVAYQSAIGELPIPDRGGYIFAGWFTEKECGEEITSETIIESDVTYYAHWTPINYSISYLNLRGMNNPNPSTYTILDTITFLPLSEKSGLRFVGWDKPSIALGSIGDITVTASWEECELQDIVDIPTDSISFGGDADWLLVYVDGKWTMRSGRIAKSQSSYCDIKFTGPAKVSFSLKVSCEAQDGEDMTDGMELLVDGESVLYISGITNWEDKYIDVLGEGEHTVRWCYSKDNKTDEGDDCCYVSDVVVTPIYNIAFADGGADGGETPIALNVWKDGEYELPDCGTLHKAKYAFIGWKLGEVIYPVGTKLTATESVEFTAVWEAKVLPTPIIDVAEYYTTETTTVTIDYGVDGVTGYYKLDGGEPMVYDGPFEIEGAHTLIAYAIHDDYFDSAVTEEYASVRAPWTIGECLNYDGTFGDTTWVRDLEVTHDGKAAMRSGATANKESSQLTMTINGSARVSFWIKTSSEYDDYDGEVYDGFVCYIDGVAQNEKLIGGEIDWQELSFDVVGAGEHTLTLSYEKDKSGSGGEDCVWIDEVKIASVYDILFKCEDMDMGEPPQSLARRSGEKFELPNCGTLKKMKYAFAGWKLGGVIYTPGTVFTVIEPMEFTAVWEAKLLPMPIVEVAEYYTTEKTLVTIDYGVDGVTGYYKLDGGEPMVYEGPFEIEGTHTLIAYAIHEDYFDSAITKEYRSVRAPWTIGECLNYDGAFGDTTWVRDLEVTHDGKAAMRSGITGNKESSQLTLSVSGSGMLTFWCKTSSEYDIDDGTVYDGMAVYVDGVAQNSDLIGGDTNWTRYDFEVVGEGEHTIVWSYEKDKGGTDGEDCIWIDEVVWERKTAGGAVIADVTALKEAFGEESSVVRNLTSEEELAKFNEFLGKCGITTASQISDKQKQYAYESFRMSAITVEPQLFENEPKLKIHEFKQGEGGWSVSISLKAGGEEIAMARKALEERIRIGNKVTEITSKPDIVASPSEDGASLTFTIAPPEGKQAFIMVRL